MTYKGFRRGQLPLGPAAAVGLLTIILSFLSFVPVELVTFYGRLPVVVRSDVPGALALLVCTFLVFGSIIISLRGNERGIGYMTAGIMLSVLVGAVITIVGTSRLLVNVMSGSPFGAELFLGTGALPGALLTTLSLGTARRLVRGLDDRRSGERQ